MASGPTLPTRSMTDPEYDHLRVDRTDGVARVVLDQPANRNALDLPLADELVTAAATLGEDPEVRCIVLTHAGDFFGVGADLGQLNGGEADAPILRRLAGRLHEAVVQFHQAPTPVLGGLDGVAAGAGFSLVLVPDVVLVSDAARLEFAYPRIGLTGDGGSTFFLPRLVGLRAASEIALLDEPIGPERAVELGLATECVPVEAFDDRLDELAERLASGPTRAYGAMKRLLLESFETPLPAQLAEETDAIVAATRTSDYRTGFQAFFDDRDPDFVGR